MRDKLVVVINPKGDVIWQCQYKDMKEMMEDIMVLSKQSMFGGRGFKIIIQSV